MTNNDDQFYVLVCPDLTWEDICIYKSKEVVPLKSLHSKRRTKDVKSMCSHDAPSFLPSSNFL